MADEDKNEGGSRFGGSATVAPPTRRENLGRAVQKKMLYVEYLESIRQKPQNSVKISMDRRIFTNNPVCEQEELVYFSDFSATDDHSLNAKILRIN